MELNKSDAKSLVDIANASFTLDMLMKALNKAYYLGYQTCQREIEGRYQAMLSKAKIDEK